ncbi:hypothetical protein K493DRAFT_295625 [Basidiobolus meristosporus CBS 931.73]|uniref:Uncharacterized protein n=1 Tax=Basidiobolus meristosporus CBS 931.73 TaxID=1314790 RepID=A0A1Y1ZAM7_9FUNG|nr:hypothetical protein K493DRAFT_295625 [Basidiobolus meristosporus CBS 931.73]|eukprot:ORY07236.1 hypothetical protein K493DRAFT_295625 [Basidiobolus meristosporus CBS 931.73]
MMEIPKPLTAKLTKGTNTTYSTTLPPILLATHQSILPIPPVLPSPNTISIAHPKLPNPAINPVSGSQTVSIPPGNNPDPRTPPEEASENVTQGYDPCKNPSDTESSDLEGEAMLKKPSGVNLSISNTDELRRLALESRESLEVLVAKTHETTPGSADKARSILISTW